MINMKKIVKNTTVVALSGVMAIGMLSGCGSKSIDGEKTVATVDGTDIPMGVVSLYARESQAQTVAMYKSFMGSAGNIWSQVVDEDAGTTYGEQAVGQFLEQVELMYIMKEKAADYGVEVTSDDETAIADAAAQFMQDNDEDTLKELAVSEDQVKTLLELETYRQRIYDPIRNEAEVNITDEEAQQSSFSYVSISISGDDLTDDDIATRKEQAQEILDKMKEDPTADMGETAKAVDDTYSGLTGTIFTNDSDDEDISNSYDDAVVEALRTLKDGEVYGELVETDSSVYVLRMDKVNDQNATASKKESLENTKRSEYYSETTQKWLDDADITVNDKVLSTLTITDEHSFTIKETTADTSEDAAAIQQMLLRILLLRMSRQQMRTRMLILLRQMLQRATAQRKLILQTALTVQTRLQKRTVQTARPRTAARALILRRTQRILQKRQLRRTKSEIKTETCYIVCIAKCFLKELRLYKVEKMIKEPAWGDSGGPFVYTK